jgi:hypothetical protein
MMSDWVKICIIGAIVAVVVLILLRKRITEFYVRFTKRGVEIKAKAKSPDESSAPEVNLSSAKFKDDNEIKIGQKARVDATKLDVGSRNKFDIGGSVKSTQDQPEK